MSQVGMAVIDNSIVLVGNLTQDPELRFTPQGTAVAKLRLAVNRRVREGGHWQDRLDGYFTLIVWRDYAEHVAESLRKGQRVLVAGRIVTRSYDKDGDTRYVTEITAEEVCPSLRWATAAITRSDRLNRPSPDPTALSEDDMPF